jgi:hypothetical protein
MSDASIEKEMKITDLISESVFEIGGIDQLDQLSNKIQEEIQDEEVDSHLFKHWNAFLKDAQIKIGTLLKADSVSFLLGAGTSKDAGGVLLGSIPLEVENELLQKGVLGKEVQKWMELFYQAVYWLNPAEENVPKKKIEIISRFNSNDKKPIKINYELVLSLLYRWRSATMNKGGRLRLDGDLTVDTNATELDVCLNQAKRALIRQCLLPKNNTTPDSLKAHKNFLKKVLTRPLNLKRVNIFTPNYDTLIEQAADAEGIVLIDGFIGTIRRIFRPESYDHDLYFPAETTEGRVHRLDRVIHLYKLHGAINWCAGDSEWNNPYGVSIQGIPEDDTTSVLIYPTPTKYGETLGMPYSELFRRFAWATVRPQTTLFVIGYGFGDDHINAIILQSLAIPSFTLVIVDPSVPDADPSADKFVARLRAEKDRRVWIFSGETLGKFDGFVRNVLPDLRDEEILEKVMKTYRSLRPETSVRTAGGESNGE